MKPLVLLLAVLLPFTVQAGGGKKDSVADGRTATAEIVTKMLNCRAAPKKSAPTMRQYPRGADVGVLCYRDTDTTTVKGEDKWDLTTDYCWISQAYSLHKLVQAYVPHCGLTCFSSPSPM